MRSVSFIFFFIVSLSFSLVGQTDSMQLVQPENISELEEQQIWATEYYVHITTSGGTIPYLTTEGDTLGYYSDTCDFCTACLEGTVFLEDSINGRTVLNYASRAESSLVNCRECARFSGSKLNVESWGSVRWKVSSGYGEGVRGYKLVPYRTIAVDPNVIPYGSVLFIPEAVGAEIQLSDGTPIAHDGYFFAGDTGGAIKKNHIDVFTGVDDTHPFSFVRSTSSSTYSAYLVRNAHIIRQLTELHQ